MVHFEQIVAQAVSVGGKFELGRRVGLRSRPFSIAALAPHVSVDCGADGPARLLR